MSLLVVGGAHQELLKLLVGQLDIHLEWSDMRVE